MKYLVMILSGIFLLFQMTTGEAGAATLTAAEILNQFNLVVLGDATSSSHVDGRAYIGGSLNGGTYLQHPGDTPSSSYAGLTVRGNAVNVTVNGLGAVIDGDLGSSTINSGNAVVLGTASGTNFNGKAYVGTNGGGNNFNGGLDASLLTSTPVSAATSTNFQDVLTQLSNQLKNVSSTGSTVTISGNKATFNAVADSKGLAVFDLSAIDDVLFGKMEFEFNLNGATTVLLNSDATNITTAANFLGGSAQSIGASTLWNFYNALDIDLSSQFGGSILAPQASLTNSNNIEGGVFVNSLTQDGEIHLQPFTGTIPTSAVPIPAASWLLGSALLGFFKFRKKSNK